MVTPKPLAGDSREPRSAAVVIVNWNCLGDVIRCVQSLRDVPVIVVDNASDDQQEASRAVTAQGAQFIANERNLGFGGGMNVGMKYARDHGFTHALMLNPDTYPDANMVRVLLEELGDAAVIGVEQHYRSPDGHDLGAYPSAALMRGPRPIVLTIPPESTQTADIVTGAAILVELGWAERVGFIDTDYFHYKEEFDFVFRIGRLGGQVLYTSRVVLMHRAGGSLPTTSPRAEYYRARNEVLFVRKAFGLASLLRIPGFWLDCFRRGKQSPAHRVAIRDGLLAGLRRERGPMQ